MDSVEVAIRITEAIMAKPNAAKSTKAEDLPDKYVNLFIDVLKRVDVALNPSPAAPPPPPAPRATSGVFPLSRD